MIQIFKTPQKDSRKIVLKNGNVYFYTNTEKEYNFIKRKRELGFLAKTIIKKRDEDKDISDCYCVIAWDLFGDYLDTFTFRNITAKKQTKMVTKKHLYWLKSDGFYKIGISYNVNRRIVDLKFEFDKDFEIVKIFFYAEHLEKKIHKHLEKYRLPIMKKTGKESFECFKICDETTEYLDKLNGGK